MPKVLNPLPYHLEIRDYLKSKHSDVWKWFSSAEAESDFSDAVQLELLKSTYRMNRSDHEGLYVLADEVKEKLGLEVPVTLYKSQDVGGPGQAALYFTPSRGHVVFGGKILSLLDDVEQKALLGHELAHFILWTLDNGEHLVADRILAQMAGDPGAEPSHFHSARLHRLYTEIFADRGALVVSESAEKSVSLLIKTVMGTDDVNPVSYLEQADEIFSKSGKSLKSDEFSHPENFIRARAMKIWWDDQQAVTEPNRVTSGNEQGPIEKEIERMIEGNWTLDELDLRRQNVLSGLTRELLRHFLTPEWVRTGRTLAHVKLFFADFKVDEAKQFESVEKLAEEFKNADSKTRHYLTHILLDFSIADRELDENGLALAFDIAEKFGIADDLETAARKELKLLKKDLVRIRKNVSEQLKKAETEYAQLSEKEKKAVAE